MGVSDEPRWEELAPYFDAVLDTTEFFAYCCHACQIAGPGGTGHSGRIWILPCPST